MASGWRAGVLCWDLNGRPLCKTMLAHKFSYTYLLAIQTRLVICRGIGHTPVASSGAMTSWPPFTVAVVSAEHGHRCRQVRCCRFPRPRKSPRRQVRRTSHQGRRHPRPFVVRRRPERLVLVTVAAVVVAQGFETASLSEGTDGFHFWVSLSSSRCPPSPSSSSSSSRPSS